MGVLSDSDYKNWIEGPEETGLIDNDKETDEIKRLKKELHQVKEKLRTKQKEVKRLSNRNEILVSIMRGKHIKKEEENP